MKRVHCLLQHHRRKIQEYNALYIITIQECHINYHAVHWRITFQKTLICILPFLSPWQDYLQCMCVEN